MSMYYLEKENLTIPDVLVTKNLLKKWLKGGNLTEDELSYFKRRFCRTGTGRIKRFPNVERRRGLDAKGRGKRA